MRKALIYISLLLLLLAIICFYNLLTLKSLQIEIATSNANFDLKDGVAEKLSKAIQIKSISYEDSSKFSKDDFIKLQTFLKESFPNANAKLDPKIINNFSLLYKWPGSDSSLKPVLFLAHLDVVPVEPGTESLWKYPPYEGRIVEGYVWGRGAIDDKVNVISLLEAAEQLLINGFTPKRTIYLAFGHDEELSGGEGAAKIAEYLQSQNVELDFVMDEGLFILDGQLPGIDKPVAYIGAAEKGYMDLEMLVNSVGGHSSQPPLETPAGILSKAILKLENYRFPVNLDGVIGSMFEYAAPEMKGALRFIFANRWLFSPVISAQLQGSPTTNALIRTTAVTTMLSGSQKANILPATARAVANFRIFPGETIAGTLDKVRELILDPRVELKVLSGSNEAVIQSDLTGIGFVTLQKSIREVFPDVVVVPSLMIGGTDSKRFTGLTKNIYRFSPMHLSEEDLAGFHGTNERLRVENLKKIVSFYIKLYQNLE